VIACGIDGTVTALDPRTGTVRWQARAGGKIYASPALGDGKVFVGSEDEHLYAFDLATGHTLWKLAVGGAVNGSPAYGEGRIVAGTEGGVLVGADAATGAEMWRVTTALRGRPAFLGPRVWTVGYDGVLRGVRWGDGVEDAAFATDSSVYSSPALVDGVAYFGAMDGRFLAVDLGVRSL
jgi:outer membrane protein assembly factor BamB